MKFIIKIFALIIFTSGISKAQVDEFSPGSPYTIFGIGDLKYTTSLRTESMGIMGTALYGNYVNSFNPAANSRMTHTNISFGFGFSFLNSTDGVKSNQISSGNVTGMNIGIPFNQNNGWAMTLGFNPVSEIKYKITNPGQDGTQTFTKTYAGSGGLNRINLGMSYIIFKSISVGFEYNYAFGSLKKLSFIDFNTEGVTNSFTRKEDEIKGSFFKGGFVADIGKVTGHKAFKDMTIGFFYQSKLKINSGIDAIYGSSISFDTVSFLQGDIEVPAAFGFGISGKLGPHITASADGFIQQWSQYKAYGVNPSGYQDNYRFGTGMEYTPSDKPDKSFWKRLSYRFGLSMSKSYYKVNDEDISTYGVSTGVGIPISAYSSIDFGLSVYQRGNTLNGLVRDRLVMLSAGINFGELWFIRQKDEDK